MKVLDTAYETLDLGAPAPGVVVVTLNRPDRYNAMTATMFDELERAAIALDDEDDLRAVILTGTGKAFRAGYDLADAEELPKPSSLAMLDLQERGSSTPGAASEICFTGRIVAA